MADRTEDKEWRAITASRQRPTTVAPSFRACFRPASKRPDRLTDGGAGSPQTEPNPDLRRQAPLGENRFVNNKFRFRRGQADASPRPEPRDGEPAAERSR